MAESDIYAGIASALLDKYAQPIIKGLVSSVKSEWEKFQIDLDIVYQKYLRNSVEKYGKVKTILYRTEPKNIYDFFECPNLYKEKKGISMIKGDSIDNILDVSNFIIIQGTGGIGKSTFLKYLFMEEISQVGWIPIFIELKDINLINGEYEISDFIFKKLYDLGSTLKKEYMEYALQSGCFLFLLDGYDEISTDKKDVFFRKFDSFCDRFSNNHFIVSSRPYSEFVEFQRFSVLTLCELSKEQALSLVKKIEFDQEIKLRFLDALDKYLYKRHQSFASNPLLLNIMLLTFDNYAKIPEKLHLFYANAFETLYSKHDATKAGYRRELRCSLSYDLFKQVFAYFCFITYYQGKIEFTQDEILATLKKISRSTLEFSPDDYIFDLVNSICVLYRDGLNYKFTHRSFQEYFTAIFLKELPDKDMQKMGIKLIKKDYFQASHDSVFSMLRDMTANRFEQNVLLPLVVEFESECKTTDKYNFYFEKLSPEISYRHISSDDKIHLVLSYNLTNDAAEFIYSMARYYVDRSDEHSKRNKTAEDKLREFLIKERAYKLEDRLEAKYYSNDDEVYALVKLTWIGAILHAMATLKETLEHKRNIEEIDLFDLLSE